MLSHQTVTLIGIILSGAVTLITCLLTQSKIINLMEYRMDKVEEKMDKHNNLVERMYKLEQKVEDLLGIDK